MTFALRRTIRVLFVVTLLLAACASVHAQSRDSVDDRYKWDLSHIYPDWDAWQADFEVLEQLMDQYAGMKGTLAQGPDKVLTAYQLSDELNKLLYKVYRYPGLSLALDTRDNDMSAKMQQVQILLAKFGTATSWFSPELLEIGWDVMKGWLDSNIEMDIYRHDISNLFRQQEHVLDSDKEMLLSYYSQFSGSPSSIYSDISTSDIKFPEVTFSDGTTQTISPGVYYNILSTNKNQADRKAAFEAHYSTYNNNVNTYAAIYNSVLQRDWADAQARNYATSLDSYLDADNVDAEVFESLVTTVRAGTAPVQRYIALRQKALGLEEYHLYDGSLPIVEFDKTYDYDEITSWVVESVKPLGKDYQKKMEEGFNSRWVDVYEGEGKRSGAFMANTYGVHPYLLLNYNKTIDNVFTVAHEMGHCMHSILSNANQPFVSSEAPIFVAEVASTMAEAFLLDHMMKKSKDPVERIVLLQHSIENIIGTFYTQVMFADFEWQAHRMVESGRPITGEALRNLYFKLMKDYYGDVVTIDDLYGSTWTRIGHFYRSPYYVYKYATCFATSAKLYSEIKSKDNGKEAMDRYINLLKAGGSDYPMELLRTAGVDLADPATIQAVVDQLDDLVSRLETEMAKL